MEITIGVKRTVEAVTIKVYAKPCDSGGYTLLDAKGETIAEDDGYVPPFFPGENYGDYLILDIDMKTGRILNWAPAQIDVQNWVDEHSPSGDEED